MLIDTHCHLHSPEFEGKVPLALARAHRAGVKEIWLVGVDYFSSRQNIEIVAEYGEKFSDLKLNLGIGFDMELIVPGSDLFDMRWFALQPGQIKPKVEHMLADLLAEAESSGVKVDLIGEIGLDNYHLERNLQETLNDPEAAQEAGRHLMATDMAHSQELQEELFLTQLQFAADQSLPVSIHSRGAEQHAISIVRAQLAKAHKLTGVFHSFTGTSSQMQEIRSLGFKIGVNGIVTYKSARQVGQAVKRQLGLVGSGQSSGGQLSDYTNDEKRLKLLAERGIVLETDSPYLIPSTSDRWELKREYGAELNEPAAVVEVLKWIFS